MAVDLEFAAKQKRPAGQPCCEPVVYPDIEREQAERMGVVAKALGDPIRIQLVDVLRGHAGRVCVCAVRQRYASAAEQAARGELERTRRSEVEAGCCGPGGGCGDASVVDDTSFGAALYGGEAVDAVPRAAVEASLGCGVPTAVADLREGETVLDLGSGAGADVLISARRVGPAGRAIGLDMTDEMLALARANASAAGVVNVDFLKGYIEELPLADGSVDVVISNCVINLSADKRRVLREAARVLRAGGRFAVSDVIADQDMDGATRADMQQWTGCIAGAMTRIEFEHALRAAGFVDIEIRETHRVHGHAGSAIIHARKPA